ncbi:MULTISPECIES: Ig-like domain-containing protein [unclassified Streptomyces]|uniref:Ig-like domain-containing protein n=1 Tax=unclassified Streptomyces TaxID=2593676 RepID=UPI002E28C89A|nr:Ig-like domain-containing protein [Streptomyces sp. NBC_00223]
MSSAPVALASSTTSATVVSDSPSKDQRIATLTTALSNITAKLAAGGKNPQAYGNTDLRDIFSHHIDSLWKQGVDGAGTTIALMEGWEDPNIQTSMNALDDVIGLPHAEISTVYPSGSLPATCPAGMVALGSYGSCSAWQGELRLDVQAAHMLAPYAKIVIVATPSDSEIVGDASSEVAMPEMVKGMEYVSQNHLADVMSISDGSSETDYSRGKAEITAQDIGGIIAAANEVPIINATGDCGAAQNLTTATKQCGTVSSGPASATWGDSPWITAIGGVRPSHTAPCPPCANDTFPLDPIEGAGLSEIYTRPSYQDGIANISGSKMRSVPDLTMNSQDGTSEAAPLFAAVVALATQVHGSPLGAINQMLYEKLAKNPTANGIVDVTTGNNTYKTIPGYYAAPGYDVASGWGTVDASKFVPALAAAAADGNPMTAQAKAAQHDLENTIALSPSTTVAPTGMVNITSTGFLPDHPVKLSLDGNPLATVTADTSGNFSYAFTPNGKSLTAGKHTITVNSMLLQQTADFTVKSAAGNGPVITSPTDGSISGGKTPTVTGTGTAGATVKVTDESGKTVCSAVVAADGTWSCTPSADLAPGSHTLTATQTDTSGNVTVSATTVGVTIAYGTATEQIKTDVTQQGGLTVSVDNSAAVVLPTPTLTTDASALSTSGDINPVTVTDTRTQSPGWNVVGQVGNFSNGSGGTISAGYLGWTPKVLDFANGEVVTPGAVVAPGTNGGLGKSQQLATAGAGSANGTAHVGATLNLLAPTSTQVGNYTATMTLTAI